MTETDGRAPLAARFTQAIGTALADAGLKARMEELGYEVWVGAPDELDQRGRRERGIWGEVTRKIKAE